MSIKDNRERQTTNRPFLGPKNISDTLRWANCHLFHKAIRKRWVVVYKLFLYHRITLHVLYNYTFSTLIIILIIIIILFVRILLVCYLFLVKLVHVIARGLISPTFPRIMAHIDIFYTRITITAAPCNVAQFFSIVVLCVFFSLFYLCIIMSRQISILYC